MSSHLESAARTLRAILAARHPEYVWTVEIRERDRHDAERTAPAALGQADGGTLGEDPHSIAKRRPGAAAAGSRDDDAGQQAA